MPLLEIKNFNGLIDNKIFFDQPVKDNQENMKNLLRFQEMMTMQQETYQIICIVKNIINSLSWIYLSKQI